MKLVAYVDGGYNNIKKQDGYGSFAILGENSLVHSETFLLDEVKTSNEAEYSSLLNLLSFILKEMNDSSHEWLIFSDSKTVVNQLRKEKPYRVFAKNLIPYNNKAKYLLKKIHNIQINWIPRKVMVSYLGH